jgi:hypothetical protein
MTSNIDLVPYIAGAYGLGVLIPTWFAVAAWLRLRAAQRRLAALAPHGAKKGALR